MLIKLQYQGLQKILNLLSKRAKVFLSMVLRALLKQQELILWIILIPSFRISEI